MSYSASPIWVVGALAVLFLILEASVRLTIGVPLPERLPLLRVKPDPVLGYRPLPFDIHYGYDQKVELNALGLRGPAVEPKASGEYRIIVLGETQLYGLGLADHELLTHVMEKLLNRASTQRRYRVINAGVRAYSLDQQLALLETLAIDLEPEEVMLLIYVYSLREVDTGRYYEAFKGLEWFMLDLGDQPKGAAVLKWWLIQFARKSAAVAWVHRVYKEWRGRQDLASSLLRGETTISIFHVERQLRRFQRLGKKYDFHVSLAVFPSPRQLVRDYPTEHYQSAIEKVAVSLGIPFFDLQPPLQKLYLERGRLPVAAFDDHYDAAAHRAIGEWLAPALMEAHVQAPH